MRYWIKKFELRRKVIFAAMGGAAVVANYGVNQMLQQLGIILAVAGPAGYIVGGQVNFFLHNTVTWRDRHPTMKGWRGRWCKFMAGNIVGLLINTGALLLYASLGFMQLWAFMAALSTSALFNWLWNHHVAFAHKPLDPPKEGSEQ